MICDKYKAVFIHVPKTAGTSIEASLWPTKQRQRRDLPKPPPNHIANHRSLTDYYNILPRETEKYYKFATIRNPWEREYSFYKFFFYKPKFWKKETPPSYKEYLQAIVDCRENEDGDVDISQLTLYWHDRFAQIGNFRPFIPLTHPHLLQNQLKYITERGELAVDAVIRFENLQEEYDRVCDAISKKKEPLPHKRNQKIKSYTAPYDDTALELVKIWRGQDIEFFNYSPPA